MCPENSNLVALPRIRLTLVGSALCVLFAVLYVPCAGERETIVPFEMTDETDERQFCEAPDFEQAQRMLRERVSVRESSWTAFKVGAQDSLAANVRWSDVISRADPDTQKVPESVLHRFCGFVEARLGQEIPSWWQEYLIFRYSTQDHANELFHEPEGLRGSRRNGMYTIQVSVGETRTFAVPESREVARDPFGGYVVRYVCDGRLVHIVDPPAASNADFVLMCFDEATRELLWEGAVWRSGKGILTGNHPTTRVEILRNGDDVTVFGADHELFVHRFEAATGRPTFRFSTRMRVR
jgi:hypothetical protein